MSDGGDRVSKDAKVPSLPGQPTEEAIASVGSEAGRSLIRGLARLGNASVSEWVKKREAKAEAARLAIEIEGRIKSQQALATARREQEIGDLEHSCALDRRARRLRIELEREQLNLEAIEGRALAFTEADPQNDNAREVDEDWLFKFTDLAQKVSNKDIQTLWARALSSAAIEERQQLSAAALQTLGLFDREIADSFRKFVAIARKLKPVPLFPNSSSDPLKIDIRTLIDIGVIRSDTYGSPFQLRDVSIERVEGSASGLYVAGLGLTHRGNQIARAVFSDEELLVDEDCERAYIIQLFRDALEFNSYSDAMVSFADSNPNLTIRLISKKAAIDPPTEADRNVPNSALIDLRPCDGMFLEMLTLAARDFDLQPVSSLDQL
ncbi:DUF2806 domain-containing protein [Rhodopseudomonas palustris]|uniref:DUF2806 domain-containing protein n=1 Tax=Rhodopseudomonas palustris (strain ATCC BAA-98 / CGA009) TaxID=258594 RepID=Q6N2V2_RHOPA|nr:DUF2806 domain-containing protein [Rhodopseudomonas palustris]OPF92638.1 hypothetical protein B1S06_15895 [Rhodopseudomonas palustris]PPQ43386.1 DUF2806 domain-containing protein [Rhodopseudomonas palustris]QQM05505.1 hypothetical protein I8G32_04074 [Rhodopseudomonas palustris]RJF63262.1 DUF2806 domain-containing protein [Rhodopseudomonas palustris]WAB76840.1 DUF2806 domain-containing protein [Rhodopseudomonas palustris]